MNDIVYDVSNYCKTRRGDFKTSNSKRYETKSMALSTCKFQYFLLNDRFDQSINLKATVKGLCDLAKKDSSDVIRYIDEVNVTSEKFLRIVETLDHSRQVQKTEL